MRIRDHDGFGHGLEPGTDSDINCRSCIREQAEGITPRITGQDDGPAEAMQFKMASRENGKVTAASWHDLADMRVQLISLALNLLDTLAPGQVIEITRIS